MTTEELLKPRYKVIGEWPYMPRHLKLGIILTNELQFNWARYQHLFKKLEWWEERDIKDMPEYVKTPNKKPIIYKAEEWGQGAFDYWFYTDSRQRYVEIDRFHLPATEQEYLTYQQSL